MAQEAWKNSSMSVGSSSFLCCLCPYWRYSPSKSVMVTIVRVCEQKIIKVKLFIINLGEGKSSNKHFVNCQSGTCPHFGVDFLSLPVVFLGQELKGELFQWKHGQQENICRDSHSSPNCIKYLPNFPFLASLHGSILPYVCRHVCTRKNGKLYFLHLL